jgi:sec-independent protein translocase protein TatA
MFKSFGWPEIVLVLVIVLIVFGVGKLPQVGGAIGKAFREFRDSQKGNDMKETGTLESKNGGDKEVKK